MSMSQTAKNDSLGFDWSYCGYAGGPTRLGFPAGQCVAGNATPEPWALALHMSRSASSSLTRACSAASSASVRALFAGEAIAASAEGRARARAIKARGGHGTTTIFSKFEWPGHSSDWPCTATMQSPLLAMPSLFAWAKALEITESVPWKDAVSTGTTPRTQPSCRAVVSLAVMARIAACGRYLAMTRAVWPVSVRTTMRGQPASMADFTAEEQTDSTPETILFFAMVAKRRLR
mmetsp:Transcript_85011/g.238027  ORF Transcript_85011/g.238027 Transcript_85011/m.238027 type:complete len:234 (-) Transcript_85011:705-1406(-)